VHSAQRWPWNEPEQLRRRYVKFNLNALVHIAEEAAGSDATCVNVSKLSEGKIKSFLQLCRMENSRLSKFPIPILDTLITPRHLK
jgi:hypothetical protein